MTNSFKTVREWVTMGGRLNDPDSLQQLARLREIWHLLLGEPDGLPDEGFNKPLSGFSPTQHRLYFSYEMRAGNSNPAVKVYTPVQNYAANDDEVIRNYEANFRQCGWPLGKDGSYRRLVESALYVQRRTLFRSPMPQLAHGANLSCDPVDLRTISVTLICMEGHLSSALKAKESTSPSILTLR